MIRLSSAAVTCRLLHAVTIVTTLAFASACRSTPAPAPAPSPDTWAVVNGQPITREHVEKAFQRVRDASQPLTDEDVLAAKLTILDDLIGQEILIAKARDMKIEVAPADLDKAFNDAKSNLSDEAFQQELTKRNLTADDMRESLRRDLLAAKVLEQEVGAKISVSDQEVSDFFNANRAQFNVPEESYHLAQIVVTPVPDAQTGNRTGDDATTAQAAQNKVAMLMQRLKEGTPFGDLARDFSEDPESGPRGGDLGLIPVSRIRQAPPALRDAVLKVSPGQARVATQNGVHTIVYVVAHEPAGQRDLSTPGVRDRISNAIRGRREQLLRTAYLRAVRNDAEVTNHLARQVVEAKGKPTTQQAGR